MKLSILAVVLLLGGCAGPNQSTTQFMKALTGGQPGVGMAIGYLVDGPERPALAP